MAYSPDAFTRELQKTRQRQEQREIRDGLEGDQTRERLETDQRETRERLESDQRQAREKLEKEQRETKGRLERAQKKTKRDQRIIELWKMLLHSLRRYLERTRDSKKRVSQREQQRA